MKQSNVHGTNLPKNQLELYELIAMHLCPAARG